MGQRQNITSITAAIALSFIGGAATIEPAQALTISVKDFVCPIDGRKFKAKTVNSYTRFGQRLDLKPLGALLAPLPLAVCPANGFPLYKRNFSSKEIARLKSIVHSPAFKQARRRNSDYFMVAFVKERLGEKGFSIAYTYLKASWETEGRKQDLHRRYLVLTISKFDGFAKTAKQATKHWWTAQLVAGNLERRLGRFEAAEKRLSGLPLGTLPADSTYRRVATQVRAAIAARDSAPRKFKPAKE